MLVNHTFASGYFSAPLVKAKKRVDDKEVHYSPSHEIDAKFIDALIAQKKAKQKLNYEQGWLWKSIGFTISLLFVTFIFTWKSYDEAALFDLGEVDNPSEDLIEIPLTEQPPPPPPQEKVFNLVEVADIEEIEEQVEVVLDVDITQDMTIEETIYEVVEEEPEEAEEIFFVVEEQPTPEGGMSAFYKYLSENLKYPQKALQHSIGGKVFLQATISKTGEISNIIVVKGIGYGCDEEAVRVLKSAPKWIPGKQRGRPVNVRMVVPITFVIKS